MRQGRRQRLEQLLEYEFLHSKESVKRMKYWLGSVGMDIKVSNLK